MGRQVAPSLPGGGNKRAADPFQVRKAAMDPEGDHEESQENGKGYGLHDRREPAGFRAEGVRCRAQVYAPVRPPATAEMGLYQESSDGKACPEGKPPEDRLVQEEAKAADRGEDKRGLCSRHAGRSHRYRRSPCQEGNLHPQGRAGGLHVHRLPFQDDSLRCDHHRWQGIL